MWRARATDAQTLHQPGQFFAVETAEPRDSVAGMEMNMEDPIRAPQPSSGRY